jgi:hypothetical protein
VAAAAEALEAGQTGDGKIAHDLRIDFIAAAEGQKSTFLSARIAGSRQTTPPILEVHGSS